jgi:hypothetical protein
MDTVTIEIDSKWVKIVHSPFFWVVATLQGVSVSFAPLFLYWSGKGTFFHGSEWIIVPSCFAVILLVGFFYMWLGGAVIGELRKKRCCPNSGLIP